MRKILITIFLYFAFSAVYCLNAQIQGEEFYASADSVYPPDTTAIQQTYWLTPEETLITTDTVVQAQESFVSDTTTVEKWKPDANKAAWWGAVVPGMGQIINKKYWKLPIVYGGFMGCAFAITFYSERYTTYRNAYRDITDQDPNTNSYLKLYKNYDETKHKDWLTGQLNSGQQSYRRYRDLSIFISIAYYGLTILEAYVDAQLYDFDISPDLSLRVQPTVINNDLCNLNQRGFMQPAIGKTNAFGVQFSFTMK